MRKITTLAFSSLLILGSVQVAYAAYRQHSIEVSHNDELFIINGERFKAKTYCFNMLKGDRVLFLKGSEYGACTSAELLNLRTQNICKVWCE